MNPGHAAVEDETGPRVSAVASGVTAVGISAAGDSAPAVTAFGICKRYGATTALDDVAITVNAGETHALVGRNGAGKSTLVSILTGLQAADSGEVRFDGQVAPPLADRSAWRSRVACVYQKSTVIPALTVAENLFLNRQSARGPIRWGQLRRIAADLLDSFGVDVDPAALAGTLSIEQRQFVEIARALSVGARFVILDEPTAMLEAPAIARLFAHLRKLHQLGVTFLFISHHLREVFELCDTVTVYRDARHVATATVSQITEDELVSMMTGDVVARRPWRNSTADRSAIPALSVRDLDLAGHYEGVDLDVFAGEIVGLTGIGGSGKVSVAETVVGTRRADSGTVSVDGKKIKRGSVPDSLLAGVGFVPEDRHAEGLVPLLSVAENTTATITDRLGRAGFINPRRRNAATRRAIERLDIVTDGPQQPVNGLSGGNAQKVVMARALARQPRVLVLISPTAGVDVRSKAALLDAIDAVAGHHTAAMIVSDELEDLRICDRVLVMNDGRLTREIPAGWTDEELVSAMEGIGITDHDQPVTNVGRHLANTDQHDADTRQQGDRP